MGHTPVSNTYGTCLQQARKHAGAGAGTHAMPCHQASDAGLKTWTGVGGASLRSSAANASAAKTCLRGLGLRAKHQEQ